MSDPLARLEASLREAPSRAIASGGDWRRAAVAAVFRRAAAEPELLYILRASQQGDPWSGQVAFPGGMAEPTDGSLVETAARETLEEVGLDVRSAAGCGLVGALDEIQARTSGKMLALVIRPYAFVLQGTERPELRPNAEVDEAFWVPLSHLSDPARATVYEAHHGGTHWRLPAVDLGPRRTLWGLTHRMTLDLLARLGQSTR